MPLPWATANPDNLGRRAQKHAEAVKVLILAYEQTPMGLGKLPNRSIFRPARPDLPYVQGVGKDIVEQLGQILRELLVEEKPHDSSHRNRQGSPLPLSRVHQTRADVFECQLRKLL